MLDLGSRQPEVHQRPEALPVQTTPLAPAPQRLQPVPGDARPERLQRRHVPRDGGVGEVPPRHPAQPQALPSEGGVALLPPGPTHLLQLGPQAAGMAGYHWLEGMPWLDAYANAAMIL